VPTDGALTMPLLATSDYSGSVSFPLMPGLGGSATIAASTQPIDGVGVLAGGPYDPSEVEYFCISFSVHQIPANPLAVSLALTGAAQPVPVTVRLAYWEPTPQWSQSYGAAAYAPTVTVTAVDGVYYQPTQTCFAVFLSQSSVGS
jgi:hypothetical protein